MAAIISDGINAVHEIERTRKSERGVEKAKDISLKVIFVLTDFHETSAVYL